MKGTEYHRLYRNERWENFERSFEMWSRRGNVVREIFKISKVKMFFFFFNKILYEKRNKRYYFLPYLLDKERMNLRIN